MFFSTTRKVLRFLVNLNAVQMAADLVRLAIVLALIGLILQGLFHLVRSVLRFFSSEEANGTKENYTGP
jgi:hypothetical protein